LLGLHIMPRQWGILRLLLAHPLLSDEELAACLALQRKSVRYGLYGVCWVAWSLWRPRPGNAGDCVNAGCD